MSSTSPEPENNSAQEPIEPLVSEFAGDADLEDLIVWFISELQDRIAGIEAAWHGGDDRRLREIAHQLKGAAASYGYPSITNSAAELERSILAEEAEMSALTEKVEDLVALCRRAGASG